MRILVGLVKAFIGSIGYHLRGVIIDSAPENADLFSRSNSDDNIGDLCSLFSPVHIFKKDCEIPYAAKDYCEARCA